MKNRQVFWGSVLLFAVWLSGVTGWAHSGGPVHAQCEQPRGQTRRITVHGGRDFAGPGEIFGLDVEQLSLKRCQKVVVTFINEDDVRHAFMVDGLNPGFMIELAGQGQATASFVTPDEDATLLLHCHVPGHERAGMKGQVVVGKGDSRAAPQAPIAPTTWVVLGLLGGFIVGGAGTWGWVANHRKAG